MAPSSVARRRKPVPPLEAPPRVAPHLPPRSLVADFREASAACGFTLRPWQDLAAQYITSSRDGHTWDFPEVVLLVARQNGKTSLLVPRIVMGLRRGEHIMHTAQDRALPRDVFVEVVDVMESEYGGELRRRPRLANGTERIDMRNGGTYRIVSPSRNGARGPANDTVIIDEARELTDWDFVSAAAPTLTVSSRPQLIYLSNAGTEDSVVLNDLRDRGRKGEPDLCYLEWSAPPEADLADRDGWLAANPSLIGGENAKAHWAFLERMHNQYVASGKTEIFRTEHLCQWVDSERPRLLHPLAWEGASGALPRPKRAVMGISADPDSRRVSAVVSWASEGKVYVHLLADFDGDPVDVDAAAQEISRLSRQMGVREVAYDPFTDRDLARAFPDGKKMQAADAEAASERFVKSVEAGRVVHDDDGIIGRDIMRTVRRDTAHGWVAVRSTDLEPVTASFAAIRAVWLATRPTPGPPRVW